MSTLKDAKVCKKTENNRVKGLCGDRKWRTCLNLSENGDIIPHVIFCERQVRGIKRNKLVWLFEMIALCLVLYTIIDSRLENTSNVIMGGAKGTYVSSDSVTFMDPNATEPPSTDDEVKWPEIDMEADANQYQLVRDEKNFLLSSAFEPPVEKIPGTNKMFSVTAMPYLEALMKAAEDAGFTIYISAGYRSFSWQNELFNVKASTIAEGMGVHDYMDPRYQDAVEEARKITMFPGSSEHQLGLAVDILDKNYSRMVYENMNQEFFEWLDSHCAEYGFIKRYPTRKLLITGWDEPWHYRYVGKEAATFIMEHDLSYEEFFAHYHPDYSL